MEIRQRAQTAAVAAVVALLAATLLVGSGETAAGDDELSALQILLRVKKTYRGCVSYRDRGEVRVSGAVEGGSFGSSLPFATRFVRDGAFRFEKE